MLVLTMVVSIVAVQVRLTGVPSYSVVVLEGVMVRVSWGGGTNLQKNEVNTNTLITFYLKYFTCLNKKQVS